MTVLMIWSFYSEGLHWFYSRDIDLAEKTFFDQRQQILRSHILGWPADIAGLMGKMGVHTELVVWNAEPAQKQWAKEQGVSFRESHWKLDIVRQQIKKLKPDVLWIPFLPEMFGPFILDVRRYVGKVVMWCGSPFVEYANVEGIDVLLTENPGTLSAVQDRIGKVIVTKPGFDPGILPELNVPAKNYRLTFCGQLSPMHRRRCDLLAELLRSGVDVDIFGLLNNVSVRSCRESWNAAAWALMRAGAPRSAWAYFREALFPDGETRNWRLIESHMRAPVFGLEMLRVLAASEATLNIHIDVAKQNSGNMRMFEATGVGTCLITEWTENITNLFEPGIEVLTYRSEREFVSVVEDIQRNPRLAVEIGKAGQRRVLKDHTLERMWRDISPAFQ